jgi:hypothetical protein
MQGRVASPDASHRPPISWCCRSIPPRLRVWKHSRISPSPIGRSLSAPSVLVASARCRITLSRSPSPITSRSYSKKISFSAEDQEQANDGRLLRGDRIVIFDLPIGRVCVLNCHEYTHAAIIDELARNRLTSSSDELQSSVAALHRVRAGGHSQTVLLRGALQCGQLRRKLGARAVFEARRAGWRAQPGRRVVFGSPRHLDKATKRSGSQLFYDTTGSEDKTLKFHEGGFHDLSTTLIRKR